MLKSIVLSVLVTSSVIAFSHAMDKTPVFCKCLAQQLSAWEKVNQEIVQSKNKCNEDYMWYLIWGKIARH